MVANLSAFIVLSNIVLAFSNNIANITSTVSVQSTRDHHSDSLLGIGKILNIDVVYIVIGGLCISICFVGCCLCYYFIKAHQNKKEFEVSVDKICNTVQQTFDDTNRKSSDDIIYHENNHNIYGFDNKSRAQTVINPLSAGRNNQTRPSSQTVPTMCHRNIVYTQSTIDSSTQNSSYRSHGVLGKPIHLPSYDQQSIQQSTSSQRSVQSQSSNPSVHYGSSYHDYGPQPYQPQYKSYKTMPQYPMKVVYHQSVNVHHQQQQGVSKSIPPPPPFPPQNVKPMQILVTSPKHVKPDSPLSDRTTTESSSSPQSSASESKQNKQSGLQVNGANALSHAIFNGNDVGVLENMSRLLEFQQIDCSDAETPIATKHNPVDSHGNDIDTPISTQTMVLCPYASDTPIDSPVDTPVISRESTSTKAECLDINK